MERKHVKFLYLLFFLTGISALVYQVLWVRLFGLVFGNTIYASSTVLSAFMGGLALGSFLAGKWIVDRFNGLKAYAVLELCIGIFGCIMPFIIKNFSSIYSSLFQSLNPSFEVLTVTRFLLSFIILIIPCTFMGATLPILSKFLTDNIGEHDKSIGRLYGINTLGSVLGCFLSGFILIGTFGITVTSFLAAAINILVAVTVFYLYKRHEKKAVAVENVPIKEIPNKVKTSEPTELGINNTVPGWVLILCCGLSGFASIALEVGWMRSLVWIMGADSYAFAAMLTVILVGIGIGSLLFSKLKSKISNDIRFLYTLQLLTGLFVIVSIYAIRNSFDINAGIERLVNSNSILFNIFKVLGAYTTTHIIFSAIIFLVPSILMGISFPLFALSYIRTKGSVGKGMGNIYSINTFGAILGSIAMGFIIIPLIGILPSITTMAGIYFASAILIIFKSKAEGRKFRIVAAGCCTVIFLVLVATTNLSFSSYLKNTLANEPDRADEKLLYFKETVNGGVMVKQSKVYGSEMIIDGIQVASTGQHDLHSHLYPAHLMAFLKKDPTDVALVAFGAGGTSGSMLLYKDVKNLDVIEICKGVVEPAQKFFTKTNKNVFADPRFNLIIQDGKNYMRMTDKKYDIIYSGPIHPQSNQGSAALYTKDYFMDCKKNLKIGGFQCLWLPLHVASAEDFKIIVKSFMEVYPHVNLWQLPETDTSVSHPHLIGSDTEILPDYQLISERLKTPGVQEDLDLLDDTSFSKPEQFISQLAIGEENMKKWVADIDKINTDDKPIVEYFKRPMNLQTAQKISKTYLLVDLVKYMENPYKYVQNVPEDKKVDLKNQLDRLYAGNKDLMQGHYFITTKNFLNMNVDDYVNYYYAQALDKIPESTYLQSYFGLKSKE